MASAAVLVVLVPFPTALLLVDLTIFSGLVQVALVSFHRPRIILGNRPLVYDGPSREVSYFDCLDPR